MWSNNYYYLNIYQNETLEGEVSTQILRAFLKDMSELVEKDKFTFENNLSFPFINLLLLKADNPNSWNASDTDEKSTNLITIVCAKGEEINFNELKRIFIRIASFLNWTLVDECSDDGYENFVIWKPEGENPILRGGF